MLGTGFVSEEVELTGGGIDFNLAVPPSVVVFQKPPTEVGERLVVEVLYLPFNPLGGAAAAPSRSALTAVWSVRGTGQPSPRRYRHRRVGSCPTPSSPPARAAARGHPP